MPIPQKQPQENKQQFISRCMADDIMVMDYPDISQRIAICYEQLKSNSKNN